MGSFVLFRSDFIGHGSEMAKGEKRLLTYWLTVEHKGIIE